MPTNPDIIIIHGGNSYSTYEEYIEATKRYTPRFRDGYTDWKTHMIFELEGIYNVFAPLLPCKDNAKFEEWKIVFEKVLDMTGKDVILIGHSLGANFLNTFLGSEMTDKNIHQLHLVSGCISEGDFDAPQDWLKINTQAREIHIWHSEDDPVVPYSEAMEIHSKLPKSTLHLFQNRKHFNQHYFPELISHLITSAKK